MAKISDHDINAIREKADIVDVIGHYIQVHRKGNSYVAICPFHDDHDPSMSISPEKKIYKCFVCGNGGNVYTFVQNYENITFPEAVGRVASLINYPLQVDVDIEQRTSKDPHKEALYNVMNAAIQYMMYQLDTPEAANEKKYLEKRGMTADLIREFQIGYNPNQTSLYHFLHAKGFSDADMNRANLIRINESGIYDTFVGRITFPIHDQYGNPIGFSARILDPNNPSKYINTNETDIFTKGDIVYNYHRAKSAARKEGKIYVCEGVTDVIAFAKAGIFNAVCTLGTSCTERQIHLLKNIAAKIVFCYDGDRAGQSATLRAVHMARKAGCDVSVIRNLTGKDPDELVREQGAEGLKSVLKDEVTWMEFVIEYQVSQTNLNNYSDKKELVRKVQADIATLPDEVDRRYFTQQLAEMTHMPVDYVPQTINRPINQTVQKKLSIPDGSLDAEDLILMMMLKSAAHAHTFEVELGYLNDKTHKLLAMLIIDGLHTFQDADPSHLIDRTDKQEVKDLLTRLVSMPAYDIDYDEAVLKGAIRKVKITTLQKERDAYYEQLSQAGLNDMSQKVLMEKYQKCIQELRRYLDEEGNK